jgi:hypothetical protein
VKNVFFLVVVLVFSYLPIKLMAQPYVIGNGCRYTCFGFCDNIYQTVAAPNGGTPAYEFDSGSGSFGALACSSYTLTGSYPSSPFNSGESCYILAGGTYYAGQKIVINSYMACPFGDYIYIFMLPIIFIGFFHLRKIRFL